MPDIPVNPYLLRDCLFTVGLDGFAAHVSQVEFTPSQTVTTWKGLTPTAVFSLGGASTWVCAVALAQDWDNASSLSNYLLAHEGEDLAVVFEPVSGGASITATLIGAAPSIGGTVDAVAVATVSMGVKGAPVLTPAA